MFWKRKKTTEFKCAACGTVHSDWPALAFNAPTNYVNLTEKEKSDIGYLNSDFCEIHYTDQVDRFIRVVLLQKVHGTCETLEYGVWVSLSEKSYTGYQSEFKNKIEGKTYFGMLSNEILDYKNSTVGMHVNVHTQRNGLRPQIIPHQQAHTLALDWENGISIEEAEQRVENMLKTS